MVGLARLLRTGCETSSALSVIKILHTFVLRLASLVCNDASILLHRRNLFLLLSCMGLLLWWFTFTGLLLWRFSYVLPFYRFRTLISQWPPSSSAALVSPPSPLFLRGLPRLPLRLGRRRWCCCGGTFRARAWRSRAGSNFLRFRRWCARMGLR